MPAMKPVIRNLLHDLPSATLVEVTETLAAGRNVSIERIVSMGQASPEGFWYDQPEDEWVMLLSGSARLTIESEPDELAMTAGDALLLPAHCRHRVTWTTPNEPTVWLAVFMSDVG
jgi:cupin 2 domain-containing protein